MPPHTVLALKCVWRFVRFTRFGPMSRHVRFAFSRFGIMSTYAFCVFAFWNHEHTCHICAFCVSRFVLWYCKSRMSHVCVSTFSGAAMPAAGHPIASLAPSAQLFEAGCFTLRCSFGLSCSSCVARFLRCCLHSSNLSLMSLISAFTDAVPPHQGQS